jgi:hypothetical protein
MQGFTLDRLGNVPVLSPAQLYSANVPRYNPRASSDTALLERPNDTLAKANWERSGGLVAGAMRTSHELGSFVSNRRKTSYSCTLTSSSIMRWGRACDQLALRRVPTSVAGNRPQA